MIEIDGMHEEEVSSPQAEVIDAFVAPTRIMRDSNKPGVSKFLDTHQLQSVAARTLLIDPRFYDYHNFDHYQDSHNRYERILDEVAKIEIGRLEQDPEYEPRVTPRSYKVGRPALQGHDTRETREIDTDPNYEEILVNNQVPGPSEDESADSVILYMKAQNTVLPEGEKFTVDDFELVKAMIEATVPSFEKGGVKQASLTEDSPFEAFAIAFADLGAALDGHEQFRRDSDSLLRERFIGIRLLLMRHTEDGDRLSPDEEELIRRVILKWTDSQIGFLEHRMMQLHSDITLIGDSEIEETLLDWMMPSHEDALEYMAALAEERKSMSSLHDLLKSVGYRMSST